MRASLGGERLVSPLWLVLDQKGPGPPRPLPTNAPTMVQQRRKDLSAGREHATGRPFVAGRGENFAFFAIFFLPFLRSFRRIFPLPPFFSFSFSLPLRRRRRRRCLLVRSVVGPKKRWKNRENPLRSEGFSVLRIVPRRLLRDTLRI